MTLPFKNARKVVANTGAVASIQLDFRAEQASTVHLYAAEPGTLELTQGVHYTVSGLNTDAVTATLVDPAAWGAYAKFALYVEYVVDQPNDVDVGGPFGQRFENALDRIMLAIQSMYDKVQRAAKMPISGPVDADNFLVPQPNQLIGWNADGTALESKPQISESVEAALQAAADAEDSAGDASQSAENSAQSAALAQRWASEAEDVPVSGSLFSAFHWARKAYAAAQTVIAGVAAAIHAATVKTPMVDADEFGYWDSVSGELRKLTLSNLVSSIFVATRTIANATFAGASFRLRNAATAFYFNLDVSGLTASRTLVAPDKAGTIATLGDVVFTKEYVSAEQVITSGGSLTLTHGFGVAPKLILPVLICKVAEAGYSVGDIIPAPLGISTAADDNRGASVEISGTTNISVRYNTASQVFPAVTKSTGGGFSLTNANWRLIMRAWA